VLQDNEEELEKKTWGAGQKELQQERRARAMNGNGLCPGALNFPPGRRVPVSGGGGGRLFSRESPVNGTKQRSIVEEE